MAAASGLTLEQRAQLGPGADLVLEGGGVKGIGLVGAVMVLAEAGYVFPRIAGTSAGAVVAAVLAAYQSRGVPLGQLETDMRDFDYASLMDRSGAERLLGPLGDAADLIEHQGMYPSTVLAEWLTSKLEPLGIRTFADLKITDDDGTGLPPYQRYRLVTCTCDLTRKALVRLPWDLPYYLLDAAGQADPAQWEAVIDSYPVVDAVRASMSIPYFFRPFEQQTASGTCTWVDGTVLQNFPVTVFDRTDGLPNRWPTFGVKLSSLPQPVPDAPVRGDIRECLSLAGTLLSEWNTYPLQDAGVGARTVYVDTLNISPIDFGITPAQRDLLFGNGQAAATAFLAAWNQAHPAVSPQAGTAA